MPHNMLDDQHFVQKGKSQHNKFNRPFYLSFLCFFMFSSVMVVFVVMIFVKVNSLEAQYESLRNNLEVYNNNMKMKRDAKLMEKLMQEKSTNLQKNSNYLQIINRTEWGAADPTGPLTHRLNKTIDLVIICHTNTHNCSDVDSCKLQLNIIQLFFKQVQNFEDIGYNFLIGGDGAVYEGIGWNYVGYYTKGYDENSIVIGFIGIYKSKSPAIKQLSAANLLLNYGLQNNYLSKNYKKKYFEFK